MNCWPDIKNKLHDIYNITLDPNVVVPKMDDDLLAFLHLLKFVPVRRVKFENALKSFVVFSEVFYFWKNHVLMHFFQSIIFHVFRIQTQIQLSFFNPIISAR